MSTGQTLLAKIEKLQDIRGFRDMHWEGSFADYLDIVRDDPKVARSAFQRLYDMIVSHGQDEYTHHRETLLHYHFFDDPFDNGSDAIYGIDKPLMDLVQVFRSAAHRYGTERRVILLHGPVGTAKSTIVRLLKKGHRGLFPTPKQGDFTASTGNPTRANAWIAPCTKTRCASFPLRFAPLFLAELNEGREGLDKIVIEGELCPACRFVHNELLEEAGGDWTKVIEQVRVKRILLSEKGRIGIGTFQPKDEKNQDSTELTGDINYRKIAEYGSDSDPRAFNFDGELNIANRGIVEFIEILKLDVAFLYDLLTASQEHKIKPKKFAHTDIDEVILGHTNEAEYRRLLSNEYMEALRDRTIKIDVPYNIRYADEVRIYQRDFNERRVVGKHIAPHTLQLAAFWAVLTRLEEPKRHGLTLVQKLRLV